MNVPLLVLGGAIALVLVWLIATYNRFVRLRQHIRESWSDIDVELKRRYELIPNLVETVKGYARHEKELLAEITELRNRALANEGSADSQATDESALMRSVKRLFAVAEAYPELKADAGFRDLQQQLADTEDRIAAARRFFNGNVREMNALRQSFPSNLVGEAFGFHEASFFELDDDAERVVPKVELS